MCRPKVESTTPGSEGTGRSDSGSTGRGQVIPVEAVEAAARALTEAATAADNCSPDEADFYKLDKAEVGNWLRARAADLWEAHAGTTPEIDKWGTK